MRIYILFKRFVSWIHFVLLFCKDSIRTLVFKLPFFCGFILEKKIQKCFIRIYSEGFVHKSCKLKRKQLILKNLQCQNNCFLWVNKNRNNSKSFLNSFYLSSGSAGSVIDCITKYRSCSYDVAAVTPTAKNKLSRLASVAK